MTKWILFIVFGVLMLLCTGLGAMQLLEKGPLLNNAYIYASKEERRSMNKKPHYRQSGTVFSLLSAAFLVIGLAVLLNAAWLYAIAAGFLIATLIYSIASSIKIK